MTVTPTGSRPAVAVETLAAGAGWHCATCGQRWDAGRLETVAAYARYVAGRALAVHGADVLLISGPDLPAIPWLSIDNGRGKLSSFVELKSEQGRDALRDLLAQADIFSLIDFLILCIKYQIGS